MSGAGVADALELLGHRVTRIDMDRDVAAHVLPLLSSRQSATEHEVVDVGGTQSRNLCKSGLDHLRGQIVRAHTLERSLHGAADRRACNRNNDSLGHEAS